MRIVRFIEPRGFLDQQEGGETSNAPFERYHSFNLDLHTDANNFAPNEFREVVNLSVLAVYKGSKHKGNNNGATERK